MCLFPISASLKRFEFGSGFVDNSITEYDCGACPECLRKRSNSWALRAVYEAKSHVHNCMITLTYDNFIRDSRTGRILGETVPDRDLKVNQRDVQLFIKRLRKYFFGNGKSDIKYIACAEYGSRTHRAHYHLILFGVDFSDRHYYKKSKRGNIIYMSNILTKLWSHGICTIDCVNVGSAVARYCTKYCAKSRSDSTFMLASQGLGISELLKDFNGVSYFIDGREYPIPRSVWNRVIECRYDMTNASYKYVNKSDNFCNFSEVVRDCSLDDTLFPCSPTVISYDLPYLEACRRRALFRQIRNDDVQYQKYLLYWKNKGELYESLKPDVLTRIHLLDDRKYHNYKVAALNCYFKRFCSGFGLPDYYYPAPGSNCVSSYFRSRFSLKPFMFNKYKPVTCPYPSRPNRASDTKVIRLVRIFEKSPFLEKNIQLSLDI